MMNAFTANTQFGLDLFSLIRKPNSNGFISPYSISAALSMTQIGAGGETARSMANALCWGNMEEKEIHDVNRKYIVLLKKPNEDYDYKLSTANRLYIDKGFSILPQFLERTQTLYFAEAVAAQFQTNPDAERVGINSWVSEQTQEKIKDLLAPGTIGKDTKMVLVNAIYFKGSWTTPFDPNSTRPSPFKVSPTVTKDVATMYADGSYRFSMDDGTQGFSALEIPYKGDQLSMVILLPSAEFGLEEMEKGLTLDKLTAAISRLGVGGPTSVELFLPKFEMTSSYGLKEPLSKMGMAPAFDPTRADFSRMTKSADLVVSDVVHKAFIKVNEEGSEAAAATAVMMMMCCMPEFPTPTFVVDHPFLFFILDKRASNTIVFMGRVVDPSSSS